jgi:ATP:ADP antiporter, AAA family
MSDITTNSSSTRSPIKKAIFDIQADERIPFLIFLVIAAANSISLEGSYVIATSGFLKNLSVEQFPLLGMMDMAILLIVSGFYTIWIDRVSRLKFVQGLLIFLAGSNFIFRFLFAQNFPNWFTYPGLYLLAEQQYILFPLAFWILANDRFSVAQSKRLFPLIAIGGLLGQIVGNGLVVSLAKFFARRGVQLYEILNINTVLFVLAFMLLSLMSRHVVLNTSRTTGDFSIRKIFSTGFDFVRNVPTFRFLAISMLMIGFALSVIEYHFYYASDQAYKGIADLQTFLAYYRMGLTVTTLLLQSFLSGWILRRVGLKNTFLIMPVMLIMAVGAIMTIPSVIGGFMGRFLARLTRNSIDRPSHQTLQGLIPEERRGRVGTFMGSYLYVLGDFLGSMMLALIIFLASKNWIDKDMTSWIYLGLTFVVCILGLYATLRARTVYDESLLDWRLARRRKGGTTSTSNKLDELIKGM